MAILPSAFSATYSCSLCFLRIWCCKRKPTLLEHSLLQCSKSTWRIFLSWSLPSEQHKVWDIVQTQSAAEGMWSLERTWWNTHLLFTSSSANSVGMREKYFPIFSHKLDLGIHPLCAWIVWILASCLAMSLKKMKIKLMLHLTEKFWKIQLRNSKRV